jgi:hypothetical protein
VIWSGNQGPQTQNGDLLATPGFGEFRAINRLVKSASSTSMSSAATYFSALPRQGEQSNSLMGELLEDHIRNHMARNSKSAEEAAEDVIDIVKTYLR